MHTLATLTQALTDTAQRLHTLEHQLSHQREVRNAMVGELIVRFGQTERDAAELGRCSAPWAHSCASRWRAASQ